MPERGLDAFDVKGPKPRTIALLALLFLIFVILWGLFVVVPAVHRGGVLWWGGVESRIMGEAVNWRVPIA